MQIPIPNFDRKKLPGIEWIPVTDQRQLPEHRHFKNIVKQEFTPCSISQTCTKDLSTPLNSAREFVGPILDHVLVNTNELLSADGKKTVTKNELLHFVMFECASSAFGEKIPNFAEEVSSLRTKLFLEKGLRVDWPGKDRMHEIRYN